jgi:hypothetical protein
MSRIKRNDYRRCEVTVKKPKRGVEDGSVVVQIPLAVVC